MQVPEKLSLIGGSILLASTLVFTLKSQASNILPKVDSGVSSLVNADKSDQSSDGSSQSQQQSQGDFNSNFQQAQQKGWQTGHWGTAKYYIDNQNDMHIGNGQLQGSSHNAIGQNQYESLRSINLDDNIQAPQDSEDLFGSDYVPTNNSVISINGLDKLDTSHVVNMHNMFAGHNNITNLDVSHFNTSQVTNMNGMFSNDNSMHSLNLIGFNTSKMSDSNSGMNEMFANTNIDSISLGESTKFTSFYAPDENYYGIQLSGNYKNENQIMSSNQLSDNNAHPGTWTKQ